MKILSISPTKDRQPAPMWDKPKKDTGEFAKILQKELLKGEKQ